MSKRNRREHGRIISVETLTRGDALAADVAAGATSITVNDAGDFDEDGGWLFIGAQMVEYTACDDDTGIIDLAAPLTDSAEQGDPVQVWSDLYDEVVDYQLALVELDGEYDNPDPVVAEVAEGVGDLPEGDRGKAGESCTLLRVAEDEWEVVGVGGRGRKSSRNRWEQDDFYTLTAADIAAGTAMMPLSHRPNDEALTCYLAGVPQRPSNWTINYDAKTLTIPLSGWEEAGDVLWVHYAYRKGIAMGKAPAGFELYGTDSAYYSPDGGSVTSISLPAGTQPGALVVIGAINVNITDTRFTDYGTTAWHVYVGYVEDLAAIPVASALSTCSWSIATFAATMQGTPAKTDHPATTSPVVNTSAAILVVDFSSSLTQFTGVTSCTPPAAYGNAIVFSPDGFQKELIFTWSDRAASSSPDGAIGYPLGVEGSVAVAIGLQ